MGTTVTSRREQARALLAQSPVIGVVRTASRSEAADQARTLAASGIALVEVTFSVPDAARLVRELLAERGDAPSPLFGMGTVTTVDRAREALAAGAEFIVTPNVNLEVAKEVSLAETFLVMGALTPSEIVAARQAGADLVKVYPLPPIGGPAYLATVRGPLGDVPMLAAGGFSVDEIPDYAEAGAVAFGMGAPLLGVGLEPDQTRQRIARALAFARGTPHPKEDR
jgi:2-dehydro-3-deoxyphosphogluconate aldolase/(4S)-4-hydroxy-2-oxoglutarate aldolase